MDFNLIDLAPVPVVMALAEVAKRSGVNSRWIPALNLVIGLIVAALYLTIGDEVPAPQAIILSGLFYGVAAAGIYDVGKKSTQAVRSGDRS